MDKMNKKRDRWESSSDEEDQISFHPNKQINQSNDNHDDHDHDDDHNDDDHYDRITSKIEENSNKKQTSLNIKPLHNPLLHGCRLVR